MANSGLSIESDLLHVLHVDDDAAFLEISKEILTSENNFEIELASSVDEALKILAQKDFNVIVSDYEMPLKDGIKFLKELRQQENNIPFILFTGKGREEIAIEALNSGADYYINKQGNPDTVYGELAHSIKLLSGRMKTEVELKQKREILEQVTENVGAGLAIIDETYHIIWSNRILKNLVGSAPGKICYSTFNNLDYVCPNCGVQKIFAGSSYDVHEYQNIDKNGNPYWIELIVTPLKDEKGKTIAALELAVNITERKKSEFKLVESEERYRQLFSMMPSGVAVYEAIDGGSDFVFKDFNKAAEVIENIPRNRVIGKLVTDVFPGVKDFGLLDVFQSVYNSGVSEFLPANFYYDNEKMGWRENWVYKLPNGDIVAIYNDASELKRNEAKFRSLFEGMAQGAFWQASDGKLIDVNQAALDIFGLTKEQFLKMNSMSSGWKVIDENGADVTGYMHPSMVALRTGKPVRDQVLGVFNSRKKEFVWVNVNAIPQFSPSEKTPYQVMVTLHDLTKNKLAEISLKESEQRYRILYEQLPLGYQSLDKHGKIIEVNQAWLDLFGYKRDEVVNSWFGNFLSSEEVKPFRERFERFKSIGKIQVTVKMKRKDDTIIKAKIDGRIIYDSDGKFKQTHCILQEVN